MVSTRFKNIVLSGDFAKAVKAINTNYKYIDKDATKAQNYYDYLTSQATVSTVGAALSGAQVGHWRSLVNEFGNIAELEKLAPADVEEDAPRQTLVEAFETMQEYARVSAMGFNNGCFIAGGAGLGKTYTIQQILEDDLGLEEDVDYVYIKGYSTPLALYETLYNYSNKLVVFDDTDSIFREDAALNILKGVLDTTKKRKVCWNSSRMDSDLPQSFEFTGRVIFISNINPEKMKNPSFHAVMTRVLNVNVHGTKEEIKDLVVSKLPVVAAELSAADRSAVKDFIEESYRRIPTLSLRTLVHIVGLYNYGKATGKDWKKLASNVR